MKYAAHEIKNIFCKSFSEFTSIACYFFISCFIIRIFESVGLQIVNYHNSITINSLEGFLIDLLYACKLLAISYVIHFILSIFSVKIANITIRAILSVFIFVSFCLSAYFIISGTPLDCIITAYSIKEIYHTIITNDSYNVIYILIFAIISIAFVFISKKRIANNKYVRLAFFILMIGSLFFTGLEKKKFRYNREYYIVENKTRYLVYSLKNKLSISQFTEKDLKTISSSFQKHFPNYDFVDFKHPFLHKNNTPDILSEYLNKQDKKPNVVLIIVEGLGSYISGKNSETVSLTPFLDSLSDQSLVWSNCLSTSCRTICVLPSTLGALPFGDNGFMSYRHDVPDFYSLATILNQNGYKNSLYYGGWYGFDDMDIFAENNFMDQIYADKKYDSVTRRNSWGLLDDYLFSESINIIKSENSNARFDVYCSLSTHDPYEYPEQEKYIDKLNQLEKRFATKKKIKNEKKKEYASFLYLDDCLKKFFSSYKKLDSYQNTIFIITGDHCFLNFDNPINTLHVPLIIWSPLLKKSQEFPALTTHRSITPSILAYLQKAHGLEIPKNATFLNSGLDTCKNFRANTFSPHFDISRNMIMFTYNEYFILDNKIFKFSVKNGKLGLEKADNDNDLIDFSNTYKSLDRYVINNNTLIKK